LVQVSKRGGARCYARVVRRRWVYTLVLVASCGRVGFDARQRPDEGGLDGTQGIGDVLGDALGPIRVAYIKASNTEAFDIFGSAVAASGDGTTIAVSAPQEDSSATGINGVQTNGTSQSGAVYVFVRAGGSWQQQAYVKPSNTGAGDLFGSSIALAHDGNTLVVGAPLEDSDATGVDGPQGDAATGIDSGAAYVFVRSGTTWTQQAYLKASNTGAGDEFGVAVAISGDGQTIAVGAGNEDSAATGVAGDQASNSELDSGAVYVFARAGDSWTQQAYIKASNTGTGDVFGGSVALAADGNTLAVAADSEDSGSPGIGGNQADNSAMQAGALYVFTRAGTTWTQQAYIKASQITTGDFLGRAMALSADGNRLVAGAPGHDSMVSNSGSVFIYGRSAGVWTQHALLKAPNAGVNDQFGAAVCISGDGATIASGAPLEDSAAKGIGGDQGDDSLMDSGAAYIFVDSGTAWKFDTYLKSFAPTAGDNFGNAIANATTDTAAVFAVFREDSNAIGIDGNALDDSALDSGAVYVLYR
jgi:hypothetical protein